jgi:hypothetical protein
MPTDWMRGAPGRVAIVLISATIVLTGLVHCATASDPISTLADTQGVTWSRSSGRELATWWRAANDLVFLGRIESWQRDTSPWHEGHLVRCHIDSIIMGYSPDSVVTFSRQIRPSFAAERLQSGTPVFARLSRRCTISGANCGDFMVIGDDGTLLSDHISDEQVADNQRDPAPVRVQDLPLDVLNEGDVRSLFEGCAGIACAVLTETRRLPTASSVWRCSETTWVIPGDDSVPGYIRFPSKVSCYVEGPPVRYLIPVPSGVRGDTLSIDCCPRVLRVTEGFSTGLGVALPRVHEVVRRSEDGRLHLVVPKWSLRSQRK